MLINEMPAESKVTLEVNIGLNTLEFETGVVKGFANPVRGIFVKPIMKDNKMINFNIQGIVIILFHFHPKDLLRTNLSELTHLKQQDLFRTQLYLDYQLI